MIKEALNIAVNKYSVWCLILSEKWFCYCRSIFNLDVSYCLAVYLLYYRITCILILSLWQMHCDCLIVFSVLPLSVTVQAVWANELFVISLEIWWSRKWLVATCCSQFKSPSDSDRKQGTPTLCRAVGLLHLCSLPPLFSTSLCPITELNVNHMTFVIFSFFHLEEYY